ncbi:ATP-binding protein [Rossellomorea vietnamensis]|uniref:ATP-binding protein n=1 Tax=Rossellomorea vietnamensis TaxID=218284 RepID=A0A5D4M5F6_9BACI|nr:ATP-binding protein [Rossellomorea vietnamensis]TYR96280.1 ATP-binding protein [Rossellomorea vietnamensis]
MLKKFTVSNFKLFEKPLTIDLSKVRDYKFNEDCIKGNLINKSIIYGKNAIGKTSLGFAITDIRSTILANENPNEENIGFLNANSSKNFARFEYTFLIDNQEVEYIYEKFSRTEIKFESLRIADKKLYDYDFFNKEGDFTELQNYEELKHLNFEEWDNEITILRYILTNAKLNKLYILKKLSEFVEGMAVIRPSEDIVRFRGPKVINKGIISTIIEEKLVEDFTEFLNKAGLSIGLKVDIKPDGEKALYFNYNRPLEFIKYASGGTKALTALYSILHSLKKITFLYVDEFDANFHFELSELMLEKFKEKENCQMLITTHNTDLMSNKFMRPDCYLLMIPNKVVSVADATLRELRQGHNLEKLYQSGEFDETVRG